MIFKGIAPSIRYVDPDFFRYELRLHWQYIAARFIAFNNQLIKAFANFGTTMSKAAESMRRITQYLPKENS